MGVLKNIAILATIGSITYVTRRCLIGRRYCSSRKFDNKELIIVTGCTSGIGLAVVKELGSRNCHLVLGCRNLDSGEKTRQLLIKQFGNDILVDVFHVDFCCLSSIAGFAKRITDLQKPIYALVNNAAIFYHTPQQTIDKLEQTFQVNYLGHFLLTLLLLPTLKQCTIGARIVNLVSKAHLAAQVCPDLELHEKFEDTPNNRFRAYQYSKLCLVSFAYKLSSLLAKSSVSVHCVDPGNVETAIYRDFPQLSNKVSFYLQKPIRLLTVKTPYEGAQAVLYAILENQAPRFYIKEFSSQQDESGEINPIAKNPVLGDSLWTLSRQLCHLTHFSQLNKVQ
ncbi:uncharacterized protein LOC129733362 [Wyeomyia smithii]|uniref:uncharacterized protein LOC129733362 n=1 Tax=Wyeomyia smithii TaxID=174621 RepID=UPI00246822C0|nr:uncharacterized protein LOC129733362 [Wyeomyia smithii]